MPQISSNFILRSKLPNFERDSFQNLQDMRFVESSWIDEGHISYCKENNTHYIFRSKTSDGAELTGMDRWTKLIPEAFSNEAILNIINTNVIKVVDNVSDLNDTLAGSLSLGRIVYVKATQTLYYNTYDITLNPSPQQATYLEDSTGWFYPLFPDLSSYITGDQLNTKLNEYAKSEVLGGYVTTGTLNTKLADYTKTEDLSDVVESLLPTMDTGVSQEEFNAYKTEAAETYSTKDELANIGSQTTTNTNAIAEVSDRLDVLEANTINSESLEDTLASKSYATMAYVQDADTSIINRLQSLENYKETSAQTLEDFKQEVSEVYSTKEELAAVVNDLDSYKTEATTALNEYKDEVAATYATPDMISGLLNTYAPSVDNHNKWVSSDLAGNLAGMTGEDIAKKSYSYSEVLDEILFNDFVPTISEPSVTMKLKESWNGGVAIDWYDEKNRVIMVKAGTTGPDGADIEEDVVVDAMISYPKGMTLEKKFTDGLVPSTNTQQVSVGFCRIQDENGEWVYYRREGNRYHVPAKLEPGSYRYYLAAFFKAGYPAVNNIGEEIATWNESTPVESRDYVTINASKPIYYNTPEGMVEKPLKIWEDVMFDTAELLPSCVLEQSFMVPRKLKALYIWNDLLGGYGQVPMVKELNAEGLETENLVPAYFNESVDENGYYIYKYNSDLYGHRGAIKIKVEF